MKPSTRRSMQPIGGSKKNQVKLLNLETVVLPNTWSPHEEGSNDSSLGTAGEFPSLWHQFVRVWFYG